MLCLNILHANTHYLTRSNKTEAQARASDPSKGKEPQSTTSLGSVSIVAQMTACGVISTPVTILESLKNI